MFWNYEDGYTTTKKLEQNSSPMISAIAFFKWTQVDVELKFKVIKFGFRIENGFNMI